jgi:hypothetical protein
MHFHHTHTCSQGSIGNLQRVPVNYGGKSAQRMYFNPCHNPDKQEYENDQGKTKGGSFFYLGGIKLFHGITIVDANNST